jgi:hypothetical protein
MARRNEPFTRSCTKHVFRDCGQSQNLRPQSLVSDVAHAEGLALRREIFPQETQKARSFDRALLY